MVRGGFALRRAAQMLGRTVIGLQAGEAQAAFGRRMRDDMLGENAGRRRRNAAAAVADVDFDEHVDRRLRVAHGRGQAFNAFGRVDGDREAHLPRQRRDASEFCRGDDFVGDVEVGDARLGERFGLARLLHAHAHRARRHLQARDRRALVHLRVRAQAHAVRAREGGHRREIALHRVEVDHQRRRIDRGDAVAHLRQ